MIRSIQRCARQICNNTNENSLLKWAVLAAFFTLLGDFITLILSIIALQGASNNNSCTVQTQVNNLEKRIAQKNQINHEIIKILEEKINELKTLNND